EHAGVGERHAGGGVDDDAARARAFQIDVEDGVADDRVLHGVVAAASREHADVVVARLDAADLVLPVRRDHPARRADAAAASRREGDVAAAHRDAVARHAAADGDAGAEVDVDRRRAAVHDLDYLRRAL